MRKAMRGVDMTQLERLCRRLSGHAVFVHVDLKSAGFPIQKIAALPGVTIVQPRSRVYWADFSQIEATLTLLKVARQAADFDRFVLISGACYPVKPLAALQAAFAQDPKREWIATTAITPGSHLHKLIGRRWRMKPLTSNAALDRKIRPIWNKISAMMGRNLQKEIGMTPYFGSSWWALTNPCVTRILEFADTHPAYVRSYRSVYGVDEHFFHTIVANSEFGEFTCHIDDIGEATNQSAPLHLIKPTGDRSFDSGDDAFALAAATDKFFIRKISSARSALLLDRIDRELLQLEEQPA
jgi:hypothetical protein